MQWLNYIKTKSKFDYINKVRWRVRLGQLEVGEHFVSQPMEGYPGPFS